jgi:hypothetical protein
VRVELNLDLRLGGVVDDSTTRMLRSVCVTALTLPTGSCPDKSATLRPSAGSIHEHFTRHLLWRLLNRSSSVQYTACSLRNAPTASAGENEAYRQSKSQNCGKVGTGFRGRVGLRLRFIGLQFLCFNLTKRKRRNTTHGGAEHQTVRRTPRALLSDGRWGEVLTNSRIFCTVNPVFIVL